MNRRRWIFLFEIILLILFFAACNAPETEPALERLAESNRPVVEPTSRLPRPTLTAAAVPDESACPADLSPEACDSLMTFEQVDGYPLYTMHNYGSHGSLGIFTDGTDRQSGLADLSPDGPAPAWACSLFAAFADGDRMLFGRNFDWQFSPALLLFSHPPDAYDSVSMVDIAYLDLEYPPEKLAGLPAGDLIPLLDAPRLPFDGMNEHGLAVGMAAVPPGGVTPDPDKTTIGSLMAIRLMLDRARTVEEAIEIMGSYNVDMGGGPPIHYLVADATGQSVLLEFYEGELVVIANDRPWQPATNFLRASAGEPVEGQCWRYDAISRRLEGSDGRLSGQEAMALLEEVAQPNTQWSIVYGMSTGDVNVAMAREYGDVHNFELSLAGLP